MQHLSTPEWAAFCAADRAWNAELNATFGKRAGDARFAPDGQNATPALAELYAHRAATQAAADALRA